ncbi:unnamed protein product [Ascophyllum nodosum]
MFTSTFSRSGAVAMRGVAMNLKASSTAAGSALPVSARRGMMTSFKERERGEEAVYMRQEDQKLLNKLLKKERTKSAEDHKDERKHLQKILGDHKLPDDVIDSLIHWKYH